MGGIHGDKSDIDVEINGNRNTTRFLDILRKSDDCGENQESEKNFAILRKR